MKNFAEKIRSLISVEKGTDKDSTPFDFIKARKGILKELIISKQSKNIIGVYSGVFGEGMFLTTVEDIERAVDQEVIVFHQSDVSGQPLPRRRIKLEEIQMVCPFDRDYKNPLSVENNISLPPRYNFEPS